MENKPTAPKTRPLTEEEESYCKEKSVTDPLIKILYEHYKQTDKSVFNKLYRALLTRLSNTADAIESGDMSDAKLMDFLASGDKIPKLIEAFRLQAEGNVAPVSSKDLPEKVKNGKEIVNSIMETQGD